MRHRQLAAAAAVFLLALAAAPAASQARPITRPFDLKAGKEEFVRAWLRAAVTDDPKVATAELLSSKEILITPLQPGRALLYLVGEARLDAVRLRVAPPDGKAPVVHATEAQRSAARKACPGFKEEGKDEELSVSVAVSSPACRAALLELFQADEYSTRRVELNFSPEALLDQLSAIRAALPAAGLGGLKVSYSGVTAVLAGKATAAQQMALMKVLYENSVGPVLFDDRLELLEEPKKQPTREAPAEPAPVIEDVTPRVEPGAEIPVQRGIPAKK